MDAAGRDAQFEQLFAGFYAEVLAYALRRSPRAVAEEVASDTFLVAWRRPEAVPDDPLPWLLAVARRTLANQRRAATRSAALVVRLEGQALERATGRDSSAAIDIDGRLERALVALSDKEREAVLLIAWEGLSPAQAAVAAGCSATAFRLRLHRARRRLADALGGAPAAGERAAMTDRAAAPRTLT
jgi:RNA polymerase sigma factor (sigma-70 family)